MIKTTLNLFFTATCALSAERNDPILEDLKGNTEQKRSFYENRLPSGDPIHDSESSTSPNIPSIIVNEKEYDHHTLPQKDLSDPLHQSSKDISSLPPLPPPPSLSRSTSTQYDNRLDHSSSSSDLSSSRGSVLINEDVDDALLDVTIDMNGNDSFGQFRAHNQDSLSLATIRRLQSYMEKRLPSRPERPRIDHSGVYKPTDPKVLQIISSFRQFSLANQVKILLSIPEKKLTRTQKEEMIKLDILSDLVSTRAKVIESDKRIRNISRFKLAEVEKKRRIDAVLKDLKPLFLKAILDRKKEIVSELTKNQLNNLTPFIRELGLKTSPEKFYNMLVQLVDQIDPAHYLRFVSYDSLIETINDDSVRFEIENKIGQFQQAAQSSESSMTN